jgi:hypothetical protein
MIQTAEEFLKETSPNDDFGIRADLNSMKITKHVLEIMRRFAKLHVEAALTEASKTTKWKEQITMQGLQVTIIKSSILNAYPLENIK